MWQSVPLNKTAAFAEVLSYQDKSGTFTGASCRSNSLQANSWTLLCQETATKTDFRAINWRDESENIDKKRELILLIAAKQVGNLTIIAQIEGLRAIKGYMSETSGEIDSERVAVDCVQCCVLEDREELACGCVKSVVNRELPLYLVHRAGEQGMLRFLYSLYSLRTPIRPNRVIASISSRIRSRLKRPQILQFQPFSTKSRLTETDLIHWAALAGDREAISSLIKQFGPLSSGVLIEALLEEGLGDLISSEMTRNMQSDSEVILAIISHGCISLAISLIERTRISLSPKTPKALRSYKVILKLISLVLDAEMGISALYLLSLVERFEWTAPEVNSLLETLRKIVFEEEIETNTVVNCGNPLLFCVAAAELGFKVSQYNLRHRDHFSSLTSRFLQLAELIQGKYTDYRKLKVIYMERAYGSLCLFDVITRKTEHYRALLKSDIVAAIVQDLWTGGDSECPNFYYMSAANQYFDGWDAGLFTLHRQYLSTPLPRSLFKLCYWKKNASLRFFLETLMLMGLCGILIVQIYTYLAVMRMMEDEDIVTEDLNGVLDLEVKLARVILVNSGTLMLNIAQKITYKAILKETFRVNFTDILSIGIFLSALLINVVSSGYIYTKITFESSLSLQEYLYATLTFSLCLRMSAILIYTRTFGQWIRMIFIITKDIIVFLLLYLLAVLSFALTYVVLFRREREQFGTIALSIRTLFQWSVAGVDSTIFTEREGLGSVLSLLWAFVSTIILLNLLIAVLSARYEALSPQVTADYASLMYQSYSQNRYEEPFGALVVAPAPLNFLTFCLVPIYLIWPGTAPALNPLFAVISYQVWFAIGSVLFTFYCIKTAFVAYFYLIFRQIRCFSCKSAYQLPLWVLIGPLYLLFLVFLSYARFVKEMYRENQPIDLSEITPDVLIPSKRFLESLCGSPSPSPLWISPTDLSTALSRLPRSKPPFSHPSNPSFPSKSAKFLAIADRIYFSRTQLAHERARNIRNFFLQFASENRQIDAERMRKMIEKYSKNGDKLAAISISAVQVALMELRQTCFDPTI